MTQKTRLEAFGILRFEHNCYMDKSYIHFNAFFISHL